MSDQNHSPDDREMTRRWLAGLLMRRDDQVLPRFVRLYERLASRPRGWRRQARRRLAITATGAAMLLAMAGFGARAAPANEIVVVNGEVNVAKNGKCSLVEAIENANDTNNGRPRADCAAGNPSGADVIVLPAGGAFTVNKYVDYYYGYSALPLITSTITVEGNGSTITRSGKNDMRFFTAATYEYDVADLTLNDLTLTNGKHEYDNGGAVYAYQATLTINNCTITGNSAGGNGGAIFAYYSDVEINDSTISDNESYGGGGIIASYGTLKIADSIISGNTVGEGIGGGIYLTGIESASLTNVVIENNAAEYGAGMAINYSTATITGSVITGNVAGDYRGGGGIYMSGATTTLLDVEVSNNVAYQGGGLYVYSGQAVVQGSTINDNQAKKGGGIYATFDAELNINNATLSGNQATETGGGLAGVGNFTFANATVSDNTAGTSGGGLHLTGGALTLRRSLVAGNAAPTGREAHLQAGAATANAHNLFGFNGDAGLSGFSAGATDVVSGAGTALAAILGPLADNTGLTHTHALPTGSPALDRAPSADCAAPPISGSDQRGQPRNANGDGAASANECDIGAYELQTGSNVDTPTPTATTEPSPTPTATSEFTPTPTATPTDGPSPTPTLVVTPGPQDEGAYLPVIVNQP